VHRLPERDLDHVLTGVGEAWKALKQSRVFITGGTGFVGTWLVESLLHASDRLDLGIAVSVLTRIRIVIPKRTQAWQPTLRLTCCKATFVTSGSLRGIPVCDSCGDARSGAGRCNRRNTQRAGIRPDSWDATIPSYQFRSDVRQTASGSNSYSEDYAGAPLVTDPNTDTDRPAGLGIPLGVYGRKFGFDPVIARLFAFSGPGCRWTATSRLGTS
jgi:dTDP-glucose 4,6-dehydratase